MRIAMRWIVSVTFAMSIAGMAEPASGLVINFIEVGEDVRIETDIPVDFKATDTERGRVRTVLRGATPAASLEVKLCEAGCVFFGTGSDIVDLTLTPVNMGMDTQVEAAFFSDFNEDREPPLAGIPETGGLQDVSGDFRDAMGVPQKLPPGLTIFVQSEVPGLPTIGLMVLGAVLLVGRAARTRLRQRQQRH